MTSHHSSDPAGPRKAEPRESHGNTLNLAGREFGKWAVVERDWSRTTRVYWLCRCECGRRKSVAGCNLTGNKSTSCGRCLDRKANPIEYRTWSAMLSRCRDTNHTNYADYGGRGITFDPRWLEFDAFLADMGPRPEGMSLDRIDNDGPYCAANCRWATGVQQHNNTRTNRLITLDGRTRTMAEWARERGINYRTVKTRLNVLGWTEEEALTP